MCCVHACVLVCFCLFQMLSHVTDFHDSVYKRCATGGHCEAEDTLASIVNCEFWYEVTIIINQQLRIGLL